MKSMVLNDGEHSLASEGSNPSLSAIPFKLLKKFPLTKFGHGRILEMEIVFSAVDGWSTGPGGEFALNI